MRDQMDSELEWAKLAFNILRHSGQTATAEAATTTVARLKDQPRPNTVLELDSMPLRAYSHEDTSDHYIPTARQSSWLNAMDQKALVISTPDREAGLTTTLIYWALKRALGSGYEAIDIVTFNQSSIKTIMGIIDYAVDKLGVSCHSTSVTRVFMNRSHIRVVEYRGWLNTKGRHTDTTLLDGSDIMSHGRSPKIVKQVTELVGQNTRVIVTGLDTSNGVMGGMKSENWITMP